ncbi:hypothetical protein [Rhodovulum sp. 12E13]|uniref:hypothetical protein n=1 Tax=Rhodovulum sp. 12E13 TaxID=2203891 RepID=UPI0011C04AEA|nr:hypothetical protein [Rhodovulum sp. 12E13]
MPVTTASRLVSDFLARHGAGLSDLVGTPGDGPVPDALDRLQHVARTQADAPEAIADAVEALRDRVDDLNGASSPSTSPCLGSDLDAAIRWYAARLTDLSRFCRQL